MQLTTSWEQKGIVAGLHRGKTELVLRQLRRRFGELPPSLETRVNALADEQLREMAEALLDFSSLADADAWLDASTK